MFGALLSSSPVDLTHYDLLDEPVEAANFVPEAEEEVRAP